MFFGKVLALGAMRREPFSESTNKINGVEELCSHKLNLHPL